MRLVRAYAGGVSDDEAFTAGLGVTVGEFEADWLASIGAAAPERQGPQPAPPGPGSVGLARGVAGAVRARRGDLAGGVGLDSPRRVGRTVTGIRTARRGRSGGRSVRCPAPRGDDRCGGRGRARERALLRRRPPTAGESTAGTHRRARSVARARSGRARARRRPSLLRRCRRGLRRATRPPGRRLAGRGRAGVGGAAGRARSGETAARERARPSAPYAAWLERGPGRRSGGARLPHRGADPHRRRPGCGTRRWSAPRSWRRRISCRRSRRASRRRSWTSGSGSARPSRGRRAAARSWGRSPAGSTRLDSPAGWSPSPARGSSSSWRMPRARRPTTRTSPIAASTHATSAPSSRSCGSRAQRP